MVFVDTNVLVYAASGVESDAAKADAARGFLRSRKDLAISVQVLNEFYHTVRKPKKLDLSHSEALVFLETWKKFEIMEVTLQLFEHALELTDRWQLPLYDALILAAAKKARCERLISEDFSHGQDYGGIIVENPFKGL